MIRALVESPRDPRSQMLVEQVARAPRMDREVTDSSYVLALPETTEDLLVELPADVLGDWVSVRVANSGPRLEFRVEIPQSGIFGRLVGRSPSGRWPPRWSIPSTELERISPIALPSMAGQDECLAILREWLAEPRLAHQVNAHVQCRSPATNEEIAQVEAREDVELPTTYAELLQQTNGLVLGGQAVFGTDDTYTVSLGEEAWWVLSVLRGEEYVLMPAARTDEEAIYLWPYDAPDRQAAHMLARNLKAWLLDSLALGSLLSSSG